jgi:hypothetical protein
MDRNLDDQEPAALSMDSRAARDPAAWVQDPRRPVKTREDP